MQTLNPSGASPAVRNSPGAIVRSLHEQCAQVVAHSTRADNEALLGESYVFASDLDVWREAIAAGPSARMLTDAAAEYVMSMLNVCQGQYRNAFKGLRMVLELCMQSSFLSAHLVLREEWLKGKADTIWATLVDADDGPLSVRFGRAFFPELDGHITHFRQLCQTLYRELSECIHGNVPNHIPLPTGLVFSQESFALWHEKARLVRLVVHFSFALRHLKSIPASRRSDVAAVLLDQLGHIEAIRTECIREI
ncbi:hypothetical protein [Paraburkholderia sp. J67]|uniref:hypothetical protein n=1 Tax=Paraburkholderia sp. J67 TaxID=2805435 RepID=UPI002ABE3FB2|nr:hypothetical protein [Paraburkholderia sp. J67]